MPKAKTDPERARREALLRRACLLPERPVFGEFRLRPFCLWTLDLCEEIGLEIFLKLPEGTKPAGSRPFQMAALVWFHDERNSEDAVDQALAFGTWRAAVEDLAKSSALAGVFPALADYLAFFAELVTVAAVRVKKRPKQPGEKEEKTPAGTIEPGGTFAMLWSIGGEQVASREQWRFLYRGLPLPWLLSFYHCALRASLAWTVAAGKGGDKLDAEKFRRAALARQAAATVPPPADDGATVDSAPVDFRF